MPQRYSRTLCYADRGGVRSCDGGQRQGLVLSDCWEVLQSQGRGSTTSQTERGEGERGQKSETREMIMARRTYGEGGWSPAKYHLPFGLREDNDCMVSSPVIPLEPLYY